jgi:N-formylglutamate amidohydrolase
MAESGFTHVVNGRFVGGHITRFYGRPHENVHAVQMELGCDAYLAEGNGYRLDAGKAARLKPVLKRICETLARWRP